MKGSIKYRLLMAMEPQPCQIERVVWLRNGAKEMCIRCGTHSGHRTSWQCPVKFYGPGDVLFRVFRFFGIPHCGGCRGRQRWLNLRWYRIRGHVKNRDAV